MSIRWNKKVFERYLNGLPFETLQILLEARVLARPSIVLFRRDKWWVWNVGIGKEQLASGECTKFAYASRQALIAYSLLSNKLKEWEHDPRFQER